MKKNTTTEADRIKGGELVFFAFEYIISLSSLLKTNNIIDRPTLFLFRHSLELFLKGIDVIFGGKPWGHNLEKIPLKLSELKDMACPYIFKKIIPAELKDVLEKNDKIKKTNNTILGNFESKLNVLSLKYNKHTYLKNFEKTDESNLFLRYPINKEFNSLIKSVDEVKFKKDVEDLYNIIMYFTRCAFK